MFRLLVGGLCLVVAITFVGSAKAGKGGGGAKSPNTVVWGWTTYNDDGKATMNGNWKVTGFVIFNGRNKRVGSYKDVGAGHASVEIDDGRIAGTIDMRREKDTSEWNGELTCKNGETCKIKVVFEK